MTKSGTNSFHGNAFEFLRDKRFNATESVRGHRAGRQAAGRRAAAQPVSAGRSAGRSCRTSSSSSAATRAPRAAERRAEHRARADRGDAGRRLHGVHVTRVQRRPADRAAGAVREQPDQSGALQSGGGEPRQAPADDDRPVRRDARTARRMTATRGRSSAGRTISGAPTIRLRPLHGDVVLQSRAVCDSTQNVLDDERSPASTTWPSRRSSATRWCSASNTVNSLRFTYNRTSIHRGNPPFFDPHDLGSNVYSYSPDEMVLIGHRRVHRRSRNRRRKASSTPMPLSSATT